MAIIRLNNKSALAVTKLREQKLLAGFPFMINLKELETNQCYLEYPDGRITLVTVAPSSRSVSIVRELNARDADNLRRRLKFSPAK